MYLMYVDESGDDGTINSPTNYFVLSAFVVHEDSWLNILDDLVQFRRVLRNTYGLRMKEEIHAYDFISKAVKLRANIPKPIRLLILKRCLQWLNTRNDISIITVRCEKGTRPDVFAFTWPILIQRFENTLSHNNFPGGGVNDRGMILCDNTNVKKLVSLLRKMRRYNPIPHMISIGPGSRNIRLRDVIEDPVFRDSRMSYFHQMIDIVAFFARQYYEPNRYIRKKGAKNYYSLLSNVVNQHVTYAHTYNKIVEV